MSPSQLVPEGGGGVEAAGYGLGDQGCALLGEEVDEAAFLGDEGVDAGGFGVEVVSDRPLLGERWKGDDSFADGRIWQPESCDACCRNLELTIHRC